MSGMIETCSAWKNNDKWRLCQTEYVVLFMKIILTLFLAKPRQSVEAILKTHEVFIYVKTLHY
jgi:hypothetical protein